LGLLFSKRDLALVSTTILKTSHTWLDVLFATALQNRIVSFVGGRPRLRIPSDADQRSEVMAIAIPN
jgi:hypothetical protein